jgi:serine/threonine-protein kinase
MDLPHLADPTSATARRQRPKAGRQAPLTQGVGVLGTWRLTGLLHRGELLTLYRARPMSDLVGPGCYAIKTPAADCAAHDLTRALLRRESAVAAGLSHPHLTSTLGSDLRATRPYLVLPYLEGITVRRLLGERETARFVPRLAAGYALWIARQLAVALGALHAAGWLHGQVRPEHAIVSPQGHATLIDLSQTRRLDSDECAAGIALLCPAYAPPEAFLTRGRLSAASDIYSLGILLFELLTGHLPFVASGPKQWAACHLRQLPPDLRSFAPVVSLSAGQLVRRMLAKEPLRRPTAAELVDRLAGLEIEELL